MHRILVVDDEEHITGFVRDCLRAEGYEVSIASNGLLAYRLFSQAEFDLIISDILMPDMDGLELIKTVKKERPHTWIIAMSGGGDLMSADVYLDPARTFGADRRINKPFDIDELLSMVNAMLGKPNQDDGFK